MHKSTKAPTPSSPENLNLVFIVSLPRSGSTMLQKVLAASPDVSTVSEPWLCLPLASITEPTSLVAEYWQRTCYEALKDLIIEIPGGHDEYLVQVRRFVYSVYERIAHRTGATTFIDKTPRYYLILPFLIQAFPNAKFILLFRNPLDTFSSILRTWCNNRMSLRLRQNYVDIMHGPVRMAEGAERLGDRAMVLHYSDLVSEPEMVVRRVCEFTGIAYYTAMLTTYRSVQLNGRMGDPTGVHSYSKISRDSLHSYRRQTLNIFRRYFLRRYVRYLGDNTLKAFGLTVEALLAEINSAPVTLRGALADAGEYAAMTMLRMLNHASTGVRSFRRNRRRPYLPYG